MSDAPKLTDFQRMEITVEALVPVIRAFEKELGAERAHEILKRALADQSRARAERARGDDRPTKMPFTERGLRLTAAAGGVLDYEILREDDEAFDFDVSRCQYKQKMEEIGALDLGPLLLCNGDFPVAEAWGLELTRTETLMEGATHCDFRYRMRR